MKAIMYGGGNIGRGFIGELISRTPDCECVFVDVNAPLLERLNSTHAYTLSLTDNGSYRPVEIKNVRGVNGNETEKVAAEIADADILFTAVGAKILPFIAKNIAAGITERSAKNAPLNIIVCENLMDADKILRSHVEKYLDGDALSFSRESVGFAEASVGRMVPLPPKSMTEVDLAAVCAEPFYDLPVDGGALVCPLCPINSVRACKPFEFYIRRKLFLHNMAHAATAYLGFLRGYEYIWQAIADPYIRDNTAAAMDEAASALTLEFPGVNDATEPALSGYCADLLRRFENKLLGDTVSRVGADTERKLGHDDRLIGAYLLCKKYHIDAPALTKAIAAAFRFTADPSSAAVEAYVKINGIPLGMFRYSGVTDMDDCEAVKREFDILAR